MNTESLKMKNTKQKACHIVTGFSLWRRTRDSLSLRFPNQPSRAVVRSASSTAAPRRRLLNSIGVSGWYACTRIATPPLPKKQAFRGPPILSLYRPQDALGQNAHAAERATRLEFTCVPKATTHTQTRMGCCWRRTRDSNSRAALATYSLSRGASSPLE